jgi:methylated-DNA-protein-cysteine methyltransferase-like protein
MSQLDANAATDAKIIEQVYAHARQIPAGRVISYGALGARCTPPISGYICGRIMNQAHDDVPWWRVVAKDGSLPIAKRNPLLANKQRQHLLDEGVEFDEDGRIRMKEFGAE